MRARTPATLLQMFKALGRRDNAQRGWLFVHQETDPFFKEWVKIAIKNQNKKTLTNNKQTN